MSYKIKSLLYFICFLVSALVYNKLSDNTEVKKDVISTEKSTVTNEALADNSENQFINVQ
ncbi:hypothetical protein QSE00_20545 [Arenibacter sp. M-2]|uniref:hypothetical protein n=1 Tax=unclassified Arenibacter TaxID=2615047 RepID=UPI000D752BEC|nr:MULTISPECIES: hypothetical protein [unclassified Arenibacter]MDL5514216.1 hypothetical protein [Arenibacter sp. M-2]PXX22510.1 hypothetical protein C7972_12432 [Arenibacter sp. ARW7G5Y1]